MDSIIDQYSLQTISGVCREHLSRQKTDILVIPVKCAMEITNGIHAIETPFFMQNYVRSGIVHGKYGLALIDSGTIATYGRVVDFLHEKGIDRQQPKYIITTHGHADHMGANGMFQNKFGSAVIADVRTVPRCLDYELQFSMFYGAFPGIYFPTKDERKGFFNLLGVPGSVDIQIMGDETRVDLGDKTLHLIESPGHTIGHISIFETNTGCLFTSDALAHKGPFNEPPYYEDKSAYLRTIEKLIALDAKTLITAHFPIRRGKEVKEFLNDCKAVAEQIDTLIVNYLKKIKRSQTLLEITQYVSKQLDKEFMIQGLFTVNTHLKNMVDEGVLSQPVDKEYLYSST